MASCSVPAWTRSFVPSPSSPTPHRTVTGHERRCGRAHRRHGPHAGNPSKGSPGTTQFHAAPIVRRRVMPDVGTANDLRRDHQQRLCHRTQPGLVRPRRRLPVGAGRKAAFGDFLVRKLLRFLRSKGRQRLALRRLLLVWRRRRHIRVWCRIRPQVNRIFYRGLSGSTLDHQAQIPLGRAGWFCVELDRAVRVGIKPVIALRPIRRGCRHDLANRIGNDLDDNLGCCIGRNSQACGGTLRGCRPPLRRDVRVGDGGPVQSGQSQYADCRNFQRETPGTRPCGGANMRDHHEPPFPVTPGGSASTYPPKRRVVIPL